MATEILHKEIEYKGIEYFCEISVSAEITDESFDHEFGTQVEWGQEITGAELMSCTLNGTEDDPQVEDPEVIAYVEKYIEDKDWDDEEIEFDFSE